MSKTGSYCRAQTPWKKNKNVGLDSFVRVEYAVFLNQVIKVCKVYFRQMQVLTIEPFFTVRLSFDMKRSNYNRFSIKYDSEYIFEYRARYK